MIQTTKLCNFIEMRTKDEVGNKKNTLTDYNTPWWVILTLNFFYFPAIIVSCRHATARTGAFATADRILELRGAVSQLCEYKL
jgi:hypothetical protein